jgi:hypothetical protein
MNEDFADFSDSSESKNNDNQQLSTENMNGNESLYVYEFELTQSK